MKHAVIKDFIPTNGADPEIQVEAPSGVTAFPYSDSFERYSQLSNAMQFAIKLMEKGLIERISNTVR